jgi:hypothetical protein
MWSKEKRKEYDKQYRANHNKEKKEYQKEYHKEYDKQYYNNHEEEIKKYQKEYHKKHHYYMYNKIKHNENHKKYMLKKYGLTLEQRQNMFDAQEGKCAICGRHQSELKKELCVDHNHKTGKVNELICVRCNRAIGMLEDDITLLQKAIDYLNKNL